MTKQKKKNTLIELKPVDSTGIILESISDGVFTVDDEWRITSFNRAAEEITGITREEAMGRQCSEVFRASMCEVDCALKQTMKTGKSVINKSTFIISSDGRRIPISVSTALLRNKSGHVLGGAETFRDLSLVEELRKELKGRFKAGDLVSRSPAMHKIFNLIPMLAASDSNVLIQGETGTGKEVIARAIHNQSARKDKPFIGVNCGALPDTLLESELFGYKKGAFTGASKDKPGRFQVAEGGTLFLDEIGEITPALQIRLLRVLQERVFEPLGSIQSVKTNVRIIAATNQNLDDQIESGVFRQDLYYRINVVKIQLPPLRNRKEDIPLLIEHFISRFNRLQNKSISGVEPELLSLLMAHDYPGNIRELENLIEHAFILSSKGLLDTGHLPEEFMANIPVIKTQKDIKMTMKAVEAQVIREALKRNQNNRLAAARDLGIHKSTLFRKMKALGIE